VETIITIYSCRGLPGIGRPARQLFICHGENQKSEFRFTIFYPGEHGLLANAIFSIFEPVHRIGGLSPLSLAKVQRAHDTLNLIRLGEPFL
jgi:hypothetical protein